MNILEKINEAIQISDKILNEKEIVTRRKGINFSFANTEEISTSIEWLSSKTSFVGENEEKIIFSVDSSYLENEDENLLISIDKASGNEMSEMIFMTKENHEGFSIDGLKFTFISQEFAEGMARELESENNSENNEEQTNTSNSAETDELRKQFEIERNARIELMADFQNFRKRMEEEKALFGAMSNMSLINDILEVFDDINLALNDENLDLDQSKSSLKSAQEKLTTAVEKAGVVRIGVNVGDAFDREIMEAISTIDAGEEMKGKVIAVINSAMKYRDRDGIIKHAKVVVGK